LIIQPFANGATVDDIQTPPQTDGNGFVNFTNGYTPFYEISLTANDPLAKAVERQVQNYMFNALTKNAMAWQGQGLPVWFPARSGGYVKDAQVIRVVAGVNQIFRSTADNNITDPANSATWMYVQNTSEIIKNVPMPAGGPGGPSAELITVATNLATLGRGTYEIVSDAVAQVCPGVGYVPGTAATAGMLEVVTWTSGAQLVTMQRYTDRNGTIFTKSGIDSVFGPWTIQVGTNYLQRGTALYAGASGAVANVYVANTVPSFSEFSISTVLNLYFGGAGTVPNTGPSTIDVNGTGPLPLSGASGNLLQGGEIIGGSMAQIRFRGTSWVFVPQYGGSLPIKDAVASRQAASLGQVNSLIAAAQINDVQWSAVKNTPTTLGGYGITNALPNLNPGVGGNYDLRGAQYAFVTATSETHVAANSYWSGTDWMRMDVAKSASVLVLNQFGARIQKIAAGANPIVWPAAQTFTICDFSNSYSRVESDATFAKKATTLGGYGITDAIPNVNNLGVNFDLHGATASFVTSAAEVFMAANAWYNGTAWVQHDPSKPSVSIGITGNTPVILRAPVGASGAFWNYNQILMAKDFTYDKTEVNALLAPINVALAQKANAATTLAGYGITDGLPNLSPGSGAGGNYTLLGQQYVFTAATTIAHLCQNASWNGAQWSRMDVSKGGIVVMAINGKLVVQPFAAGANPLSFPNTFDVINSSDVATETKVGIAPIAPIATVNAGVDDFASVTSKKLRWGVSMSLGPNGFLALPSWLGGVIFNWGRANVTGNGQVILFPKAYPSEVFVFIPGTGTDTGGAAEVMNTVVGSLGLSGVTVNATSVAEYHWLSVGR